MAKKKPTFSIFIPVGEESKENLALNLSDLDYYLERAKCNFSEIFLVGQERKDLEELTKGFKEVVPEISFFSEEEAKENVKGEMVMILKPGGERSFSNFEKMVDLSKKRPELLVPYKKRKDFGAKLLNWKTSFLSRLLRFKKKITVVRDSNLACLESSAVNELPLFNLAEMVVFGELSGYKVKFAEMPEGSFFPRFLDYLKAWWAMIVFKAERSRRKAKE